jgi:hypothetical protein
LFMNLVASTIQLDNYNFGDSMFVLYATKPLVHNIATGAWRFAPPSSHNLEIFQEFCSKPSLKMDR